MVGPIKLPGRALSDDGQMICSYVSKSAWLELVYNKVDCSWRIEMYRFRLINKLLDDATIT